MSASTPPSSLPPGDQLHVLFLTRVLPRVERHGRIHFRHLKCAARREEAIAEMIGLAWKWFVQLAQRGKDATQFVSALAVFAARSVHSGRRVCGQEAAQDVLSPVAQWRRGFTVERLPSPTATAHGDRYATPQGQQHLDAFEERLRDNAITPVPDQVQFRIDFPNWLQTLTGRERRLIREMARGERTKDLSRHFEVSPARISQLRREFQEGWRRFCGDLPARDQAGDPS
jgi:hypothetical protein